MTGNSSLYQIYKRRPIWLVGLHVLVVLGAIMLVAMVSVDALGRKTLTADKTFYTGQFIICLLFMGDTVADWIYYPDRKKYMPVAIVFLIICVPYTSLIQMLGIKVSGEALYWLRIIPLLRAGYMIACLTTRINASLLSNLFPAYCFVMIALVYFSSLMFYVEECPVNPGVGDYWSALWWSAMNLTTAGCDIHAVTGAGKVLSVVLSGSGIMLFPVFTVYISSSMTRRSRS